MARIQVWTLQLLLLALVVLHTQAFFSKLFKFDQTSGEDDDVDDPFKIHKLIKEDKLNLFKPFKKLFNKVEDEIEEKKEKDWKFIEELEEEKVDFDKKIKDFFKDKDNVKHVFDKIKHKFDSKEDKKQEPCVEKTKDVKKDDCEDDYPDPRPCYFES